MKMNKDKISSFIKKRKIILGLIPCFVVLPVFVFARISKPNIDLNVFDSTLIWRYNKNLGDDKFVVYKNGEVLLSTKQTKLKDNVNMDKTPPNSIEELNITHSGKKINIEWNEPNDNGDTNTYKINVEDDKGNIKASSNEMVLNSTSGVSEYKILFNGNEFYVSDTEFEINSEDIDEGIYNIDIVAIDKTGNKSDVLRKTLDIYKPYISNDKIEIDNGKEYDYKLYLGGKNIKVNGNVIDMSTVRDISAPDALSNVLIWNRGSSLSAIWKPTKDLGSKYDVEIIGTDRYGNTVANEDILEGKESGVKGYYYAIKSGDGYTLSSEDSFSKGTILLNANIDVENPYFYIAPVDNAGNMGEVLIKKI